MKICLLLLVLGLSACSASPQFTFFNGLFGGQRNRPQRPQNNVRHRPTTNLRGGRCGGGHEPNHNFDGQSFLVSWKLGCTAFTVSSGEAFCRANGMRPISLDSSAKEKEFLGLVEREHQAYFWTGGKVSGRNISWPSRKRYNSVNWSHTGG